MIHYYTLDTETTGLKADYNEIFQISILRHSDGFQITKNIGVEYPERASREALNVTGKTVHEIQQGMTKAEAIVEIDEFFAEDGAEPNARCIIAHNSQFDRKFCKAEWASIKEEFPADLWLCTMAFFKQYAKRTGLEKIAQLQGQPKARFSLANCLKGMGIEEIDGAHSATIDVRNTANLYNKLMAEKLNHVSLIKNEPHLVKTSAPTEYDTDIY